MGQVGGGKVTGEEFDQSDILLFRVGVVEHFAVVSGVVGPVLSSPGLVGAAEEGEFLGNERPCGGGCEVAVVGWAVAQLGLVADHCLWVFVSTESFVDGLFPWEGEVADVGYGVGCAPFGVSMLSVEMSLDFEEEVVLGLVS